MTAPSPQQQASAAPAPYSLRRILLVVGTILFVLASFAAGGHTLGGITDLPWAFGALGAWIAFRLIGLRVELKSVLALESLVCAIRSTAVFIPHALGAQEAAYAVLSPLFGIGAEFGLAVSVLKRARDLALGIPILLIWQAIEGRRARSRPAVG